MTDAEHLSIVRREVKRYADAGYRVAVVPHEIVGHAIGYTDAAGRECVALCGQAVKVAIARGQLVRP